MYRTNKTGGRIFWALLGATLLVWVLRGLGALTIIPGSLIWMLLISTIGSGIISVIQYTKRW